MPNIIDFSPQRALDLNGMTVPGALATFYDAGTSSERTVYADPGCTVPHPSPLPANGAGVFPPVYDIGGDVRVTVTDADGVTLAGYPMDPASTISTEAQGAAGVVFEPTVEIPETSVQAAIERVQENIVAPLADFGLGVTGNSELLASINATDIASGFYRYDATTDGTFPAGVDKTQGGVVSLLRQASGAAVMSLTPANANRIYYRRLASAVWAGWQWLLDSDDTATDAVWAAGTSSTPVAATPAGVKAAVQAIALGDGQLWTSVSRSVGTTYRNTTGRSIMVAISYTGSGSVQVNSTGSGWNTISDNGTGAIFVVPHLCYYRILGGSIVYWAELR